MIFFYNVSTYYGNDVDDDNDRDLGDEDRGTTTRVGIRELREGPETRLDTQVRPFF